MSETQRWYAGLPVTGRRELSAEERKHVAWVARDIAKTIGRSVFLTIVWFAMGAVFIFVRTFPTVRFGAALAFLIGLVFCVSRAWMEQSLDWGVGAIVAARCSPTSASAPRA